MKQMKRILLPITMGMSVRNVLRSDIFKALRTYCEVVIVTPFAHYKEFRKEFEHPNVRFVPFCYNDCLSPWHFKAAGFFIRTNYWGFWLEKRPDTIRKYVARLKQEQGIFAYFFWMAISIIWNFLRENLFLRNAAEQIIFYSPEFKKLMEQQHFDMVFVPSHDAISDIVLMYEAKKRYIPVVVLVHSWDNLPSRGRFFISPDRLLVWNKIMCRQAEELHIIPKERIVICGIPQYDHYHEFKTMDKAAYLKFIGGIENNDTRIITYTCVAERVMPDEPEFIMQLIELAQKGVWGKVVLVIRLHPTERQYKYKQMFSSYPIVRLNEPDASFAAANADSVIPDGREDFVNLMANSDVVINMASTITIDAILFDKPVVNIAYNPIISQNNWNCASDWYLSSHFKHIIAARGTRCAETVDEFVEYVKNYLENPELDAEGRRRIRQEQCYKNDKRSGMRVAKCVLDFLNVEHDLGFLS